MKKYLLMFFLFLFAANVFSTIYATTEEGKRVALNEDGTWEYVDTKIPLPDAPIKIISTELLEDEMVKITLMNVSSNTIKALKLKFMLFDDFGSEVGQQYGFYISQGLTFIAKTRTSKVWSIETGLATKIHAYPTEVVFINGSKWVIDSEEEKKIREKILSLY